MHYKNYATLPSMLNKNRAISMRKPIIVAHRILENNCGTKIIFSRRKIRPYRAKRYVVGRVEEMVMHKQCALETRMNFGHNKLSNNGML